MKKIKWKQAKGLPNILEGFVDGEQLFSIEGLLCVTDLRPIKGEVWKHPEHYRIKTRDEGKQIAFDLLNDLNLDIHHKNRDDWEKEHERSAKVIQEAEEFLKKLQNERNDRES